jgi:hypothetical protein
VDVNLITSFRKFESPPCACVDLGWPIVLLSAVKDQLILESMMCVNKVVRTVESGLGNE